MKKRPPRIVGERTANLADEDVQVRVDDVRGRPDPGQRAVAFATTLGRRSSEGSTAGRSALGDNGDLAILPRQPARPSSRRSGRRRGDPHHPRRHYGIPLKSLRRTQRSHDRRYGHGPRWVLRFPRPPVSSTSCDGPPARDLIDAILQNMRENLEPPGMPDARARAGVRGISTRSWNIERLEGHLSGPPGGGDLGALTETPRSAQPPLAAAALQGAHRRQRRTPSVQNPGNRLAGRVRHGCRRRHEGGRHPDRFGAGAAGAAGPRRGRADAARVTTVHAGRAPHDEGADARPCHRTESPRRASSRASPTTTAAGHHAYDIIVKDSVTVGRGGHSPIRSTPASPRPPTSRASTSESAATRRTGHLFLIDLSTRSGRR